MLVLGIESSCDETGVALYHTEKGLLANEIYSQVALHAAYGGVVPELASRDHICKITPLLKQALTIAQLKLEQLAGIAYTAGPGLIGALLVGASFAKSLAFSLKIPAIAINHMEAHLYAAMLEGVAPTYPFLALLVSGGHTMLLLVKAFGDYTLLGETVDDAVGEAFDKTAKLLGLPYPGGPQLAQLAQQGVLDRYRFPRPMTDRPGLLFSFSGLKTHALTTWLNSTQDQQTKADIAAAFQQAVVATLVIKIQRALKQTAVKQLVIAGGVSANVALRTALAGLAQELTIEVFFPRHEFCSDNGAMVAFLGALHLRRGHQDSDLSIKVQPRWPLASCQS